jgi:F-type H+-transporting ATPase subunit gamma
MIGSRVQKGFEKYQLLKTYRQIEVDFAFQDAQVIGIDVLTKFNYQEIDSIKLAYTRFINYSHFQPTILQLLPIVRSPLDAKVDADIEFEPNQNVVIETAVPLYLYTLIHGAVMESKLVEYASRCLVTEKAIENSKKMHEELLMKYNQLRQNKITQEIIEITGTLNT